MAETNLISNTLPTPLDTTVSDIARRSGLSRTTVRRRLAAGWTAADLIPIEPIEIPQCVQALPTPVHPRVQGDGRHWILGLACTAIGIAIASVGLVVNARYAGSLGRTLDESLLLAALGLTIDASAVILLSVSAILWRDRHWLSALTALVLWIGAAAWSMIATAGFTSQLIGDTTAGRASVIEQSTDQRQQRLEKIASTKMAVASAMMARDQECGRVGPNCRQRVAELNQRQADLTAALEAPIVASAAVGVADPAAHMLAALLHVDQAAIQKARIAGLTVAPITAGLFLAFAALLLGRRRATA